MKKAILLLCLCLFSACSPADNAPLPTLAVLPTLPPQDTAGLLNFWQAVNGTLTSAEQVARWHFSGQAGDAIRLRALGPVNLALTQAGVTLAEANDTLETTLPEAGLYEVHVRLQSGDSGSYELGLGYTDRPNPASFTATPPPQTVGVPTPTPPFAALGVFTGALDDGDSLAGAFRAADEQHVYTFEGQRGQYVSVGLSPVSGEVDPLLTLYSPAGAALALDDNSGGSLAALLRNIPLREDGLYSLQASGGGFTGAYQITLARSTTPQPITPTIIAQPTLTPLDVRLAATPAPVPAESRLQDHVPVIGSISRPGLIQRYFFTAAPGDFVTVGARSLEPETLRMVVDIITPAGELLRSATMETSENGDEALVALLPITEENAYTVLVTAEDGGTGDFLLSYGKGNSREGIQRGQAEADTPYQSVLSRRAVRDVWLAQLYEGDVITATVSPLNNALDPVLELAGPDGELLVQDDNSGGYPNPLLREVHIPASGVYELRVSAANADSIGPYRLVWRYVTTAPTFTPAPPSYPLMSVNDDVAEGDYSFYPLQAQAGQRLRVQVNALPGSELDPVAVLLDAAGNEIARGDDSDTDLNPRFTVDIPADGTYTVRVNGYLSGGAFELLVEVLP